MKLQSLQLVAFIADPAPVAARIWLDIFGEMPPTAQQLAPSHTMAAEPSDAFDLELQCQPGRIDLIATGPSQTSEAEFDGAHSEAPTVRYIKDIDAALAMMGPAILKAVAKNTVNRIAAVVACSRAVDQPADGVGVVRSFLGTIAVPDGATELEYRVNVPSVSIVDPNITFNRIVKWGTSVGQIVKIGLPGGVGGASPVPIAVPIYLAMQSIDVNTVAGMAINPESLGKLFDEMIDSAKQLIGARHDTI